MPVENAPAALSIAIIGVGQIGSAFAYQLASAGHDVTVIARPDSRRLQQLEKEGAIVLQNGQRAAVRVDAALDNEIVYDLVIVTTKAFQIAPLLPMLKQSSGKNFHFLFANFSPEKIRDALPEHSCAFGMPFLQAWLDRDGRLRTRISSGQKTLHSDIRWVKLFQDAGLPSAYEPDMMGWLRWHAPMTVAIEGVCVAGQRRGRGARWREARTMARGMRAGFAIIRGLGFEMHKSAKTFSGLPVMMVTLMLWAMSRMKSFRELLASGENEARAEAAELIAAAENKPNLASAAEAVALMLPS